jgi:hypothetical protein
LTELSEHRQRHLAFARLLSSAVVSQAVLSASCTWLPVLSGLPTMASSSARWRSKMLVSWLRDFRRASTA